MHTMQKLAALTKTLAWIMGLALLLIGLIIVAPPGFVSPPFFYNDTPSLPKGFYYAHKTDSTQTGALIRVCVPESWAPLARERGYLGRGNCPGGTTPVGKMVVAGPGDTVQVTHGGVQVGGHLLSGSIPRLSDSKARPLRPRFGWYVLGPGECFVLNTRYGLSFDSRYFGPVACEVPHYVLYPASPRSRHVLDSLSMAILRELRLN